MLTDKAVRALKPRDKAYKVTDERGLVMLVDPRGGRYWRFRYRHAGREKMLSLGTYPDVSLKRAREKRDELRSLVADGLDPGAVRKAHKAEQTAAAESFGDVADEYFALHSKKLAESTRMRDERILKELKAPLTHRPLKEITAPEILAALRRIEAQGKHETTHRALGLATRIYEYAIATGKATHDASSGLRKAIAPVVTKSHSAITDPKPLGALLRAIDAYNGQPATIAALKLLPMLFTRPGELRRAQWTEFDLESAQWLIPAERMKLRREHLVPLPKQACKILEDLDTITGAGELVFPALRKGRPLSENTLNVALRTLGYDGSTHVSHGFRSTASTLLHEMGWDSQVIELQLAHADRNKVRAAYNRSERLPDRRRMMQAWADYLDGLKADDKGRVTSLRAG